MKNNRLTLLIIFSAALLVRIAYTVFFVGISTVPDSDSVQYNNYAVSIAENCEYRDGSDRSYRSPLYPLFLAGVYSVFGHSYPAVKIVQAVLGALICVLVYILGFEYGGNKTALYSGLFSCVYFGLFDQSAHILTETLFTFLLLAAALCYMKMESSVIYRYLGPVFAGLSALARPTTLIFPAFIALWFASKYPIGKAVRETAVSVLIFCAVIVPWTIRNYSVLNRFVPVSTDGGITFGGAHNADAKGQWSTKNIVLSKYSGFSEVDRDKKFFSLGVEYLKGLSAAQFVKLEILKLAAFIYPFLPRYDITYGIVFPFWIYGVFLMYKKRDSKNYLMFFISALFFTSALIICGSPRFRGPMSPYIIVFGATGLENVLLRFNHRIKSFAALSGWLALNILMYFYYEPVRMLIKKIRDI